MQNCTNIIQYNKLI